MFGAHKSLITVTRTGLQVEAGPTPLLFTPTSAAYANLDVLNDDVFTQEFKTFLIQHKIKAQSFVLYLTEEVLFQKDIQLADQAQLESVATTFFDEVPFEDLATKTFVDPKTKTTRLVAGNKKLVDLVRIGTESTSNDLFAVVAANTIPFISKTELKKADIREFLDKDSLLRSVNLVDVTDHSEDPQNVDKAGFGVLLKNKIFQIILVILCFLAAGLLVMMAFGLIKNPFETPIKKAPLPSPVSDEASSEANASTAAVASVSAVPKSTEKIASRESFPITVSNGTGTPGQASTVKDSLSAKGYLVTVDPKPVSPLVTEAMVSFGSAVPQVYKDELLSLLSSTFETIKQIDLPNLESTVIIVTTGLQASNTASSEALTP